MAAMTSGKEQPSIRIPFVDLVAQHTAIDAEVVDATMRVLRNADFILGRDVERFEEEFARFCGSSYGIGVDSGTSALELALRAYGIGAGDEVITVANTFIATVLAISDTGATPVLVDIDPATHTIDVDRVAGVITSRTRAIVPVHLYGQPADMDPLLEIAERHHLIVIEDACQAHGASYKGRRAGSLGHAAAFSFYPSKNLGACGDGGIVVTGDARVARSVQMLRNYGQEAKYHHTVRGYNRRLDTLQAAVLRVKLKHLDRWNAARRQHANAYSRLLSAIDLVVPEERPYAESVWHLYVIQLDERDALKSHLEGLGIAAGTHYPVPIHLQPAYRDLGYRAGDFPVTEHAARRILSLPMYPELAPSEVEYVAAAIRAFVSAAGDRVAVA